MNKITKEVTKEELVSKLNIEKEQYVDNALFQTLVKETVVTATYSGLPLICSKGIDWLSKTVSPYLPSINIGVSFNGTKIGSAALGAGSVIFAGSGAYEIYNGEYDKAQDHLIKSSLLGLAGLGLYYFKDGVQSFTKSNSYFSSLKGVNFTSFGFGAASLMFGLKGFYESYQGNYSETKDLLLKSILFAGACFTSLYHPTATLIGTNLVRELYSISNTVDKYDNLIEQINLSGQSHFLISSEY